MKRTDTTLALVVVCLILAPSCGGGRAGSAGIHPRGRLITAEQIARSDAVDAWEALQRWHVFLTPANGADAAEVQISRRGMTSGGSPLVVVDGTPAPEIGLLRQIPAHHIASILVLSGSDGMLIYGEAARSGAIVVRTLRRTRR